MEKEYVIGVDFGTDSVRAVIVDAARGAEMAASVFYYPRWKNGLYCDPVKNQFRQHPLDYIEGLESTITTCLTQCGKEVALNVKAISIDTTGSTPVAVDGRGTPLALLPQFENNPNAMFVLWKDHTATVEATEMNIHASSVHPNYLQFVGGKYSSEWFWAKLLHILKVDETVRNSIASFVEHCDWIPFLLCGGDDINEMKRSVCGAGHKALWSEKFGGLPPDQFFSLLNPLLKGFTSKLFTKTYTSDQAAGTISPAWARKLGLPESVLIGVGAFDAHMGAVGGQIEPYYLSKVMGTSTCDMLVVPIDDLGDRLVRGICGQVPGSVIPGMIGLEAGQSAFGDAYAWFKNLLLWPIKGFLSDSAFLDKETAKELLAELDARLLPELNKHAELLEPEDGSELALDWFNGRRTPDTSQLVKGALTGLKLATDAPRVFRAVAEATCFGAKAIVDRFNDEGVPVRGLIGIGGVAKKSPFIMQMMADVLNMPIKIHKSEQTCALGAAMFAATIAGIYQRVEDAMSAMGLGFEVTYYPNVEKTKIYRKRYKRYQDLGAFLEDDECHISKD